MPTRIVHAALALALLPSACGFFDDEHLVGPYRLVAVESSDQMMVDYSLGSDVVAACVEPTVFAVGWNERHLVAKQHPENNRTVTSYFYLDMTRDPANACSRQSVVGPLSEAEYRDAKARLELPEFSITIASLQ